MEPHPPLTIVLLGHTGVGKSASGNTILGRQAFESRCSFTSVTKDIKKETEAVFGKQISMFDTPGILGSEMSIKELCQDVLQSGKPCLFLVVVSVGRFTNEQEEAVGATVRVLGDDGLKKSYILFTSGDSLKNMDVKDFTFEDDESPLPAIVERFAGKYHVFNNVTGGQEQVRELLIKSGHLQTRGQQSQLSAPGGAELPEMRIVLLGLLGAGKSSSGNTILGSEKFKSTCDFDSVTTKTASASAEVEGHKVTVVDIPGFSDEVLTPKELFDEIMKTFTKASPGPHAFLLLIKTGRIPKADMNIFQMLQQLFGRGAHKYTIVLFTHGDSLKGQFIKEKIQSNQCVSDLVSMCDDRYCVFDNNERDNRGQVQNLMDMIHEMIESNEGRHFSSEMFKMAETFITEAERNQLDGTAGSNETPEETALGRLRPHQRKRCWECFCCCLGRTTDSDNEENTGLIN